MNGRIGHANDKKRNGHNAMGGNGFGVFVLGGISNRMPIYAEDETRFHGMAGIRYGAALRAVH